MVTGPSLTVPTTVIAYFLQSNLHKSEFADLTFEHKYINILYDYYINGQS